MKSLTGKFASSGGWALLLILLLGAGLFVAACGDEDVPTPTTPAPPPPPPPAPPPAPEPEPEPEPEAPAVPVGLRISGSGTDFVEWSWTPVADVSGYDVQFSPNEAFTGEDEIIARTAEEISYRRDGLAEGTSAFLRVRSAAGTGEERITSDWSTHVTGMTEAPTPEPESVPPAMPTGLAVSDSGEDFIEWSWDPVEGASGYDVQFSENQIFSEEDETISRSVEQVSYRREELETGTSYYLRVRSAAGTGEERITSDWSTHVTGMTEAPTPVLQPPAMPTGLAISDRGENFIEWSWDPADGASGYDVQFSENQVFSEEDETISRTLEEISYRREELEAETSYYLRVRSAAGTGEERITSDWSTHVTGTTTAAEPDAPLAPANLRVKDTGSDFIEWEWDDVAGASGYQAQFSTDSAFSDPDTFLRQGASNTTQRVSNLGSEADGYLRVRAYLGTLANPVFGEWSEAKKATTDEPPAAVALDAPDNVETSDRQDNSIAVAWDAVDDAEEYQVQQRAEGGLWGAANCGSATGSNAVTGTSCVASGLDEDTEYDFRVKAFPDSSDSTKTESGWSGTASATTTGEAPPPPVTGGDDELNVQWTSTATAISWNWDPVANREDRARIDHLVYVTSDKECATVSYPAGDPSTNTLEDDSAAWTNIGMNISVTRGAAGDTLPGGAIRTLCMVRTWEEELGSGVKIRRFGTPAVVRASTSPKFSTATNPKLSDSGTKRDSVRIEWAFEVDSGFKYPGRVVFVSRDDSLSTGNDACEDAHRSVAPPNVSTTDDVSEQHREDVGSDDAYQRYAFCVRAETEQGESSWQRIGGEVETLPGKPVSPSYDPDVSEVEDDATGTHIVTSLAWSVPENDVTPRKAADNYEATIYRSLKSSATVDTLCENTTSDYALLGATVTYADGAGGISIAATPADDDFLTELELGTYYFHVCVRAKPARDQPNKGGSSVADDGPWSIGKTSGFKRSIGKPSISVVPHADTSGNALIRWSAIRGTDPGAAGYEAQCNADRSATTTSTGWEDLTPASITTSNSTVTADVRSCAAADGEEAAFRVRAKATITGSDLLIGDWSSPKRGKSKS